MGCNCCRREPGTRPLNTLASELPSVRDMRILILSDDKTIYQRITNELLNTRNRIKILKKTRDLNEIGVLLSSFKPEIVILDDDMLRPDSSKVVQIIKHVNDTTSVIFLTSDGGIELGRRIGQLGVQFYSHKPIEAGELCEALRAIIKKLQKQRFMFGMQNFS